MTRTPIDTSAELICEPTAPRTNAPVGIRPVTCDSAGGRLAPNGIDAAGGPTFRDMLELDRNELAILASTGC